MKLHSIIIALIVMVLASESLHSIPAFARQHRLSCQACHAPAPRLKPYGDEFAGNGFVLPDKESPRYFVETGDGELSLIRDFPVAARMDLNLSYNTSKKEASDFATPYLLKFLSGGSLGKDVAYYFYFFFDERGKVAGIEDAFVMFNNLFGIDLDLYVGQFQISDPLFKRELRLTFEDYDIYKAQIGLNNADLTYDRGIMVTLGLETGTDIIFEVVNGNGIGGASGLKLFDDDKYKNFLGRISQNIGEFFRVGAFAYYGKQSITNDVFNTTSEFTLFGPDFSFTYEDYVELNVQYLFRNDINAVLAKDSPSGTKVKTSGGFAELIFLPKGDDSKQYGVLLFNHIDSDIKELRRTSATVHLGHSIRRNFRFFTEYTYYKKDYLGEYGRFNIGIVTGF